MKVIDFQKIDLTDIEYAAYQELVKRNTSDLYGSGEQYFRDLFKTDGDGIIMEIAPKNGLPWEILFWTQNIMINQRLEVMSRKVESLQKKIKNTGA